MKTLEEASTISNKDKQLLSKVKKLIQGFLPTAEILLYGSVARGAQYPESDYDILVLTDEPLTTKEQNAIRDPIFDLELKRDIVICTMFYTRSEWDLPPICASPFHENVEQDALVL